MWFSMTYYRTVSRLGWRLGRTLDAWNVGSAPHHYGRHYGNYAAGHLRPAIRGFAFVEWDEAQTPGLDAGVYSIEEGMVNVPQIARLRPHAG